MDRGVAANEDGGLPRPSQHSDRPCEERGRSVGPRPRSSQAARPSRGGRLAPVARCGPRARPWRATASACTCGCPSPGASSGCPANSRRTSHGRPRCKPPPEQRRTLTGPCPPHRPTRPRLPVSKERGSTLQQSQGRVAGSSCVAWSCEGGSPSSAAATKGRSNGTSADRKRHSRGARSRRSRGSRSATWRQVAQCGIQAAQQTPRLGACRPHGWPRLPGGRTCTARRKGPSRSARCRPRCQSPMGGPCSALLGHEWPEGSPRGPSPASARPDSRGRMPDPYSRRPAPRVGPAAPGGHAPCTTRARGRRTPGTGQRRHRPPAGQ
mmetsp:Transcript_37592/g.111546  ORF Transcript_37592/g.111546 Transcript_37592/m.111546 type:complete len:324 (+) Transcript_37592:265-1236(+)